MDTAAPGKAMKVRRYAVLATAASLVLVSCATVEPDRRAAEYLDEATGATITRVEAPFTFYSDDPSRAANARDYLDAAPLSVNQSGKYSWWLWLGVWSTIDRGASGGDPELADIATLQLMVDGEPMELGIQAATDRIPGAGALPYTATVAPATIVLLPLTGSQVLRLSRAASISIRTEMADGEVRQWQPWVRHGSWTNFAELAAVQSGVLP
ncbi:MAG: hypothetical protein KDI87_08625 [Gammaproteobacteria bacterium]|nr:hypothetical protein [Gammaproteobacteria bacterium]